jgi:hypothetical protein
VLPNPGIGGAFSGFNIPPGGEIQIFEASKMPGLVNQEWTGRSDTGVTITVIDVFKL